ncbi:MAG: hypothetical protein JWR08_2429 [Enterovirga sp.]|nr:hypothetical protein [Enterovirga sp.]
MSETRNNRFEIDLDEIERQLRRSADLPVNEPQARPAQPALGSSADPLAELARIVGQDDPFIGILGDGNGTAGAPIAAAHAAVEPVPAPPAGGEAGRTVMPAAVTPRAAPASAAPPALSDEERGVLGSDSVAPLRATRGEASFDPVVEAYGSHDAALDTDDFRPLPPRHSRARLVAVLAVLLVTVLGAAAAFTWRRGGVNLASSGPPPLIRADSAPLKVAPENPGGMDIPDQSKQIYEGMAETGKSRVLDRQEQPIDVREMARAMPVPDVPPPASVPPALPASPPTQSSSGPGPVAAIPGVREEVSPEGSTSPSPTGTTRAAARPQNALTALGEPRRVRTVAVRPDGSMLGPPGSAAMSEPTAGVIPTSALPPPISVATVSVPANGVSAPSAPAASASQADAGTPSGPVVAVLPPERPRSDPRVQSASIAAMVESYAAPTQTAAVPSAAAAPDAPAAGGEAAQPEGPVVSVRPPARPRGLGERVASADPEEPAAEAPSAGGGTYAVQLAVRPTEQDARAAWDRLGERFAADLGGKPATVTEAQVNGKTVYRVRVTPLSRQDANTLCTRLKSSGGQCWVVTN